MQGNPCVTMFIPNQLSAVEFVLKDALSSDQMQTSRSALCYKLIKQLFRFGLSFGHFCYDRHFVFGWFPSLTSDRTDRPKPIPINLSRAANFFASNILRASIRTGLDMLFMKSSGVSDLNCSHSVANTQQCEFFKHSWIESVHSNPS